MREKQTQRRLEREALKKKQEEEKTKNAEVSEVNDNADDDVESEDPEIAAAIAREAADQAKAEANEDK